MIRKFLYISAFNRVKIGKKCQASFCEGNYMYLSACHLLTQLQLDFSITFLLWIL